MIQSPNQKTLEFIALFHNNAESRNKIGLYDEDLHRYNCIQCALIAVNAIQKVALKKGNAELSSQRVIAKRSGFNEDDFNAASDIPEFKSRKKKKTITLKSGKTVTVEED